MDRKGYGLATLQRAEEVAEVVLDAGQVHLIENHEIWAAGILGRSQAQMDQRRGGVPRGQGIPVAEQTTRVGPVRANGDEHVPLDGLHA